MEIEIKKTPKIKIKYDGQEFLVSKPTIRRSMELDAEFETIQEEKKSGKLSTKEAGNKLMDVLVAFLVERGLPEDFVKALDADELEQVKGVFEPKKKG